MSEILSQAEWDRTTCVAVPEGEGFPDPLVMEARLKLSAHDAAIRRQLSSSEQEVAAAREEARRLGELLVEYHNELCDAQWGTEWECPSCRRVAKLGHYRECSLGNLLARWPEVKP